ncbi:response regulator [Flavihumibacter stibioxidans]|uniref:DNA-binding response regulator n=1 Tax=Flavihumibacter stibioxidans TaxID=1834163 RepID=A0ABR7M490_9BACT|nr:response regulator transcription factor [Flavihumibacter stibioxidans]MBC6489443.1 hypothetical protein [Flavihumibacter stibioxidans]
MNKTKIRLAIVDDHRIVIDGLKSLLHGHESFQVVVETDKPVEMLQHLRTTPVDILLTDIMMPVMNGAELARKTRQLYPQVKVLALSMSGQGNQVNQLVEDTEISGYVLKNIGKAELIRALEKIASGGVYFSEEVIREMQKAKSGQKEIEEINLTAREIEIIRLIEKEKSNKEIAESLFISERTVETHRKNIFRKTKTASLIGLVKFAYEHGLI